MIDAALIGVALLLALGPAGAVFCSGATPPRAYVGPTVYGTSALVCVALAGLALASISTLPSNVTLPLGLPWVGAHFRLDALSAFFLFIAGLGGTGASSTPSGTAVTTTRRTGCYRSIRCSWAPWCWWCSPMTHSASCSRGS